MNCSCCGGALALATGVCIVCGFDEMDYYDDMPEFAAQSHAGCSRGAL